LAPHREPAGQALAAAGIADGHDPRAHRARPYVGIAALPKSDWARNVRAAGTGELAYGRRRQRVALSEVTDPDLRRTVVRAFPTEVPHGVPFFVRLGLVKAGDPDEFAGIADRVAVFELRGI
jgi:hypothetical protein